MLSIFWKSLFVACLLACPLVWAEVPVSPDTVTSYGASAASPSASASGASARQPASVQRRPKWEVGVGGGYFSGFDYPASSNTNQRFLALPFFIYRTPRLRFGDGGVRAVAIEQPRVKLDISLGGALNAPSEGNTAREGMEDLDYLLEIGPQLQVSLLDKAVASGGRVSLRLSTDLRFALSTDFKRADNRGVVLGLGLGANYRNVKNTGIDLLGSVDATFGSERLQDYYYEVDPEYATDTRPEFDAKGGYLQTRLFAGVGYKVNPDLRVVLGAFAGLYGGARNEDSPLYETTSSTGFALGVVWTIKASKELVEIVDLGSND